MDINMGITYSFADNTVYGTEDINDITRSLVGAGVAPFVSKTSYNVSDLNAMTSALVGSGVQLDGCKCTVFNKGAQNMGVTIAQGIVFFESGVRLTVDSGGYTVAVSPNRAGFIYAYYNQALQTADILFADSLPTTGESVCLAEISAQGELADKREFARAKVATLGRNVAFKTTLLQTEYKIYKNSNIVTTHKRYAVGVVDADISGFNYAIVKQTTGNKNRCVFDLKNNKHFLSVSGDDIGETFDINGVDSNWWYHGSANKYCGFEVVDGVLTFFTDILPSEERFIDFPTAMTITLV